ncbi:cupin domain-containing protein [Rhizobium sp. ZW T2_16]|uniref:AraC family transcriptional regulator n=1 Tax=Rhizobium sp. ZW T2_16 TaxID=3378083 RepID=UPI003854DE35
MSGYSPENGSLDPSSRHGKKADLLSDVLRIVQLRGGSVWAGLSFVDENDLPWPSAPTIHVVTEGTALFSLDQSDPFTATAGEIVLFPRGGIKYRISAVDHLEPIELINASFHFDNAGVASPLLELLPDVIHITPSMDSSSVLIKDVAQFLVLETRSPEPGFSLMISRVIDILVIRCIRTWAQSVGSDGWVGALGDERISRAVAALHREPTRAWAVADLAALAGMSRSSFSDRFTKLVGEPPLRYLLDWRLTLAFDMLNHTNLPIKEVAFASGYESEAAFSRAFRSKFGFPPAEHRSRPKPAV